MENNIVIKKVMESHGILKLKRSMNSVSLHNGLKPFLSLLSFNNCHNKYVILQVEKAEKLKALFNFDSQVRLYTVIT